jgi:NAD(P)-dependent dehydrogenase (short-subunit alcohol dehydrogenase family)
VNLTGKVFIVTGALGALGQAVTVCLTAHGAKLALLGNRVRPGVEHPAGALIYTGLDLSREDAAGEILSECPTPISLGGGARNRPLPMD